MTLPRHATVPLDRQMKAPYNFIPLPEKVLKAYDRESDIPGHDIYKKELLAGHINLEIRTETYLYTRCAYRPEFADRKIHQCEERQQFFHHGDAEKPVLPGSSIRGMLRSLMEIIGYCKTTGQRIHDERLIYRDVAGTTSLALGYRHQMRDENIACGYLHKKGMNRWIQPAEEHEGRSFGRVKEEDLSGLSPDENGISVWCVPAARITELTDGNNVSPGNEWKKGTLFKSGQFSNQNKYYVVFSEDNNGEKIKIPNSVWRLFEQDKELKRPIKQRGINNEKPVFYLTDESQKSDANPDGLVFLGPTRMFRVPYPYSTLEFVPESLRSKDVIDFSEAIFGNTRRKGRVRFSDALFDKTEDGQSPFIQNNKNGCIVPRILSSPKPTSFQNYLVQPLDPSEYAERNPRELLLSYHHPYGKTAELIIPTGTEKEIHIPTSGTVIRGTKLYWNGDKGGDIDKISEPNGWERVNIHKPQNTVIRPVRPGTSFSCRIYFENLSDEELGLILTALSLTNGCRHRLGMGKPYGMGRIKITFSLKIEDRIKRYESLGYDSNSEEDHESETAAKRAIDAFHEKMKDHYKNNCKGEDASSVWDIPRLADLKLLLHANGPNCPDMTEYAGFGSAERHCWTKRRVLPTPGQVWKYGEGVQCNQEDVVEKGKSDYDQAKIVGKIPLLKKTKANSAADRDDNVAKDKADLEEEIPPVAQQHKKEAFPAPTSETIAPEPIKAGDTLLFSAFRKGNGWKFRAVELQGEGSLQPGTEFPLDIAEGKEYKLTVVYAGNNKNKGMFLRWDGK